MIYLHSGVQVILGDILNNYGFHENDNSSEGITKAFDAKDTEKFIESILDPLPEKFERH